MHKPFGVKRTTNECFRDKYQVVSKSNVAASGSRFTRSERYLCGSKTHAHYSFHTLTLHASLVSYSSLKVLPMYPFYLCRLKIRTEERT